MKGNKSLFQVLSLVQEITDTVDGGPNFSSRMKLVHELIEPLKVHKPVDGKKHLLKICSWNANGILPRWTSGDLSRFLSDVDPDVLFISEIKTSLPVIEAEYGSDMQNLFKSLGYHCYWHWCDDPRSGPGKWGCLYASKLEPKRVQFGMTGGLNNEGRVITAFYEKFCVPCTYTPCSEHCSNDS